MKTPGATICSVCGILLATLVGTLLGGCGAGGDAGAAAPTTTVTVTATATVTVTDDAPVAPEPSSSTGSDDGEGPPGSSGEPSFVDGVLTTSDVRIEIIRYEVIAPGEKGNEHSDEPVIAFWYDTTNLTGADVTPLDFVYHFTAVQDNDPDTVNELNLGGLPDDRFLDSQLENIKKGGTVENAVAYELDDLTTPVDLVASELFGEELGRQRFAIR